MLNNKNILKCECSQVAKINYIAQADCAKDDADVAALPETWIPKQGGPILTNYLREQEQGHKKVLKDIVDNAVNLNANADTKVRALVEMLLVQIKQNQLDIDCVIEQSCRGQDSLSKDNRNEALKSISKMYQQRIQSLAAFKCEAAIIERERADTLRILIRDQFQKLIAVGYLTPKDLLRDFDERIYQINQQLLSNSRAYIELEMQLRVQADESVVRTRSRLNQLCLGAGLRLINRGRSAASLFRQEKFSQIRTTSTMERKRDSSEPSIEKILGNVEEFNECVSLLLQAYKDAVLKVFTNFSDNLSVLETNLINSNVFFDKDLFKYEPEELQNNVKLTLHRLSTIVEKKQTKDIYTIANTELLNMQKSLLSLGERFKDTYQILFDAGHLWDAHMLRLAHAQKLTMAAVEDLFTSNDMIQFANEVAFNVAFEQLLCSSDTDKAQQQFEIVLRMLDRIGEMYVQHNEAELSRLEDFMNLPSYLSKILLSEFNCFLEQYHHTSLYPSENRLSQPGVTSPRSTRIKALCSPVTRAILQTELQEVALRNWRNGFLESFESNVSLVPEELRHQAQLWVEERASALHMRYSLKLLSHSIRSERVKAARDRRLFELNYHERRLNSHLKAIYNLIDCLLEESTQFLSIDSPNLYPLCQWIDRMFSGMNTLLKQDPLDPEIKRLKMSSYALRLTKHRDLYEKSLDAAINEYKRQLEYRIQEARISNVRFISHIKLFTEGGRYAVQEALKTCNALLKASDALEVCLSRAVDALFHHRGQLLNMADHCLSPLQKILGGNIKTGGKNVQATKKKQLPKKR